MSEIKTWFVTGANSGIGQGVAMPATCETQY